MKITSAYNFVPLSSQVFLPDWAGQVSHDMPLPEGFCGTLALNIRNHTPILPGQIEDEVVRHFTLPDGTLAIPGSTLRGMVRSVLEIASFGKLRFLDDRRYSMRDLTRGAKEDYGDKFTLNHHKSKNNKPDQGPFEGKSKAGWLFFDSSSWKIQPCKLSRVDSPDLDSLTSKRWNSFRTSVSRPTAIDKYEWWGTNADVDCQNLSIKFDVGEFRDHLHGPTKDKQTKELRYSKATRLSSGSKGKLVFTGQPSDKKHLEFVFHSLTSESLTIDGDVMRGFRDVYVSPVDMKSEAAKHYAYLKKQAEQGAFSGLGIPVFYLAEGNVVKALGLSMMFKLPYKFSTGDLVDHASALHRQTKQPDLAELIFGYVDEGSETADSKSELKGRVSFSVARTDSAYDDNRDKVYRTVLQGPKLTFYPNYLEQPTNGEGGLKGNSYNTMMSDDAKVRGWKRYPQSGDFHVPDATASTDKLCSRIRPLAKLSDYEAKMRFHNLSSKELGAIVWCLEWGGDEKLRHGLGMGKSFGLGQISISIDKGKSRIIANCPGAAVPTFNEFLDKFVTMMNSEISNWESCDELTQLKAMANPSLGDRSKLKPMVLDLDAKRDDFARAKGAKSNTKLVLEPHVPSLERGKKVVDESEAWFERTVEELIAENSNAKRREIVCGKALAGKWQELAAEEFKLKVLDRIKNYWEENAGGWQGPHTGKSRKTAFKIYNGEE